VTKAHYDLKNIILLNANMIMKSILGTPQRNTHILFLVFLYICTPPSTDNTVTAKYANIIRKGILMLKEKSGNRFHRKI